MEAFEVTAEKLVYGGQCIAKLDGKNIFIPYGIPGEKYKVKITQEFRDYAQAEIIEIIEQSPERRIPSCPLYQKCGGCNLMHIQDKAQQNYRAQILRDAFSREGVEIPEIQVIEGNSLGYRCRFQLHNGGLMEKGTNNIVQVNQCPCATQEVNLYLAEMPFEQRPKGRVHIFGDSRISSIPQGYDKIIVSQMPELERHEKREKREAQNQQRRTPSGRLMKKKKKVQPKFTGTALSQADLCTVEILGKKITFDVKGFFQSNLEVLEKSISTVMDGFSGTNVLDMYAGCGTFSTFLTDHFKNVTLVEHNRDALVYAEQNLAGKQHQSFGVSGENFIQYHLENCIATQGPFDCVVIDPPRSGMERPVRNWLCRNQDLREIRSISCDVATHARDIKELVKSGWKLERLYLLDFYPQTGHIESLGILKK